MKKLKRISAILIIGTILATLLVSCKSSQQSSGEDPTKAISNQGDNISNDKAQDLRDEIYPAFDMGGRTIRIATKSYQYRYYDSRHESVTDCEGYEHWSNAESVFDNLKRVEQKYNVRIEYVPMKAVDTEEPYADIYETNIPEVIQAVSQGKILPLKEYVSSFCDIKQDKIFMRSYELFGEEYAFSERFSEFGMNVLGYNKDLINSLELEDPRSLYDKGEWTWDKFAEYAKLATKDLDGDELTDQYGYFAFMPDDNMGFIYANNGVLASGEKEELSSTNVIEALQFLNKIYNEDKSGLYYNTSKNPPSNDMYKEWEKGNILFMSKPSRSEFEIGRVPFPLGPHGDGTMYHAIKNNVYYIPKGVEKPEQVYQIFEEFTNWHNFDEIVMSGGPKDVTLTEEETMEFQFYKTFSEKFVLDIGALVYDYSPCYDAIISEEMSFDDAIILYKDKLQDALDKLFMRESNSLESNFFE